MLSFRPTFLVGVPRIFEKIFNGSAAEGATRAGKGAIFDRAATVAIDYGRAPSGRRALALAEGSSTRCSTGWSTASCAQAMGGELRYAITGGASLGERLGHFYAGIGLTVMEGYGLTETTAVGHRSTAPRPPQIGIRRPADARHGGADRRRRRDLAARART